MFSFFFVLLEKQGAHIAPGKVLVKGHIELWTHGGKNNVLAILLFGCWNEHFNSKLTRQVALFGYESNYVDHKNEHQVAAFEINARRYLVDHWKANRVPYFEYFPEEGWRALFSHAGLNTEVLEEMFT